MEAYSRLLFARPSFIEGIARLVDLGGTLQEYNALLTPEQADYVAIQSDWKAVSNDLSRVLAEVLSGCTDGIHESLLAEAAVALGLDTSTQVALRR